MPTTEDLIRRLRFALVAALVILATFANPITVRINGKKTLIRTEKDIIQNYDGIMTPAIAKAVTQQQYKDLFVNDKGLMFGNGQIWVNGICLDTGCKNFRVKVVTIQDTSGSARNRCTLR